MNVYFVLLQINFSKYIYDTKTGSKKKWKGRGGEGRMERDDREWILYTSHFGDNLLAWKV